MRTIRRLWHGSSAGDDKIHQSRSSIGVTIAKGWVGAVILAYLLVTLDLQSISSAILGASWALPLIVVLHLVQLALSGCAWRAILPRTAAWPVFFRIRWIREGVAGLLPFGPLSAGVVGTRLLARHDVTAARATASLTVDLTAEMASQIVFLLCGIALLPAGSMTRHALTWIVPASFFAIGMCAAFLIVQRVGLFRLFDLGLARLARRWPRLSPTEASGFHEALLALHRDRKCLLTAVLFHSASWMLGSGEIWLALYALHHEISLQSAFILESIGMAVRSTGFAIPGTLGVQEAGFFFAGGLVGLSPDLAIAVSFMKRIREFLVAGSGLFVWGWEDLTTPRAGTGG
jgi:putative membrane protein